ncbi:class I adenylate-forming enzyme family protein [Actinokineospora fastidiosa]|uniref:Long-chain-fatty-acid--CoA ligase n=1 Tax=Actinokineospora fastidiosa TaxID=1816 RepID=A0A918GMM6_9PSEU|nr:AMP-binding protein [Actinokineospora fastidiosa]GGS45682.1 long-chain-fatty-acid--CoA ligase [Actinokineospora fastidiosa]
MPNTAEALWRHASATPDRVALLGGGDVWTYRELRDRVAAVAGHLREVGVRPGDRVLLVAPSVPEFVGAYYGVHAVGAIAVTANTMSTGPELEHIGTDAGVVFVLSWDGVGQAPGRAAEALGVPCLPLVPGLVGFDRGGAVETPPATPADATAAILYTSGTTGRPKGAQLTHGNLEASGAILRASHGITAADRGATALPLFHVYGQACVMNVAMQAGASLALLARFEPSAMLSLLRETEPTFLAGVPTMWNALLHAAGAGGAGEFAGLRHASSGGASLPAEVMRAFEERFGCAILEAYGLTETCGAATYQDPGRPYKPGHVGIPLPGCAIAIRDEGGADLPAGEVGEVHISGPVVMKGYWNRPDATAEVLRDGWLRTGDLGTLDADGDLRIVDRKKDMMIRGGYNVYPSEVEEVLYGHPDIVEAAVVSVPDDHYGEEVAAVITLRPGAELATEDLRAWAKERLSAYKVPHLVAVVDELPKGPTGKILKRAIDRTVFSR